MRNKPEGWLDAAIILFGWIALFVAVVVLLVVVSLKVPEATEPFFINEEPIPLEDQIEHDLEIKYGEWIAVQTTVKEATNPYLIDVTEEEKALMARVVMSEVGSDYIDYDIKQAVASTIVNRVRSGKWGTTVTDVVTYPHAYWMGDNGEPTPECWEAVEAALIYEAFPIDMYYFKEGSFHDFGYPLMRMGNTFFSTEKTTYE